MVVNFVMAKALRLFDQLRSDVVSKLIKQKLFEQSGSFALLINEIEAKLLKLGVGHRQHCCLYHTRCILFLCELTQILRQKFVYMSDSGLVVIDRVKDLLNDKIAKLVVD